MFHSANDKVRRTQWIPACAGMTRLNINFLSRLRCARFRVPIPACAGMTIFVNKNCKKYFDKLLFSEVFIAGQWGIVFLRYCYENYFLINVFAIVMDSGVISEPLIMRATSFTRSSPVISQTDVVVLSLVTDLDILK